MNLYIYVPVPPAIIPTYFTFLVTGSAFFSGRIANSPEKRERDGKHWRKQETGPMVPSQHVQLIDFVSVLSSSPSVKQEQETKMKMLRIKTKPERWLDIVRRDDNPDTDMGYYLLLTTAPNHHYLYFYLLMSHTPRDIQKTRFWKQSYTKELICSESLFIPCRLF